MKIVLVILNYFVTLLFLVLISGTNFSLQAQPNPEDEQATKKIVAAEKDKTEESTGDQGKNADYWYNK
ncbi:MAG: hypothetical protein JSU83_15405 [Deltaproteobacteria bacterium]|nr:MAG: hypothetical protein JSU83_15405 [Deltaproteobacteria bacterium]